MATYSFHRHIMGKVEIGNFYRLIWDNRIYFYRNVYCFIRLLLELLNLIGCQGNVNSLISKKSVSQEP